MKRLLSLSLVLLCSVVTAWAESTYNPTADVFFRTNSGNTGWHDTSYPMTAETCGDGTFAGHVRAGMFTLQKYTVENLQYATSIKLTISGNKDQGPDALAIWTFTNDWSSSNVADNAVTLAAAVKEVVGVDLRSTGEATGTPLISGTTTKTAVENDRICTYTFDATALAAIKAAASYEGTTGTFTLLITNKTTELSNSSSKDRKFYCSAHSNADFRPTLTVTTDAPTVKNLTTGATFKTLKEAWAALTDADTELEVSDDQTLDGRLTWSKAHTLTITPTKDITIKGHRNGMWFLANTNGGKLIIGGNDYAITMDGQSNTFEYDVVKYENSATVSLTNVTFQNFDLNGKGHLVGSKPQEGQIILENITLKNCSNPLYGFICKTRVTNDRVVLKGYFNQEGCTGTTIYAASETKTSGTTGRIMIDDSNFTANSPITIFWGVNNGYDGSNNTTNVPTAGTMQADIVVVIGTSADNAAKFQLTDETWALTRKSNGDLIMAVPATPTAQIGETKYADLAAALAAVQDGETIMLLADQEVSNRINVKNMSITIDGGGFAIKRATGYTNGMLFLTQTPDEEKTTALTLQNVTIDGQNVEATAAIMEVSNYSPTTLTNVTFKNCKNTSNNANHQSVIINNKAGGVLNINGVSFTDCQVANGQALIFAGTNNVTLKGTNIIPSIYLSSNNYLKVDNATIETAITLLNDDTRTYGLLVENGTVNQFANDNFRLSQQQNGIYAMPKAVANAYSHPALLHTAANIEAVKANLATDNALFNAAYQRLEDQSARTAAGAVEYLKRMDETNWSGIYPDYNNFSTNAATDARLAYQLALRYQLKDEAAAAQAAVKILNDWATTNKGFLRVTRKADGTPYANAIPDPNEYLMCIQAYQFANAAELLRDYTGWSAAAQTNFKNWIRQTFADVAILFLENHHNNANALHYWLNWDLAALNAMLSVGVLCDDKALVDYALNYVDNGQGTGNKQNAIVATHNDTDSEETLAQCQESGRDQGHATLDISLLGVLCQTAKNIGTDLFTPYKALEMAEYVGKYNLKAGDSFKYDNVPFTEYTNGEETHTAISADARGTERNCWELFLAYAKENDKAAAYTTEWVQYLRNKYAWGEGEATTNDELGFGTLMFATPNDIPSGISTVESSKLKVESYYDLSGRRVAQPTKGLYIVNGKKVVVK